MKDLIKVLPSGRAELQHDEYIDHEDGLIHCSRCGEPKQIRLTTSIGFSRAVRIPCFCEREEQTKQNLARCEEERRCRIEQLRSRGIRSRLYRNYTFAEDNGLVPEIRFAKEYVRRFERLEPEGSGLLFWGGVGTGKTYLAACIANALIDREISALITSIPEISNAMTGLFSDDRNRYLDSLNDHRLLIIDDLGVERNTEYSLEQVYSVIDSRYRSGRPMLLTTNLTLEELEHPRDREHARIYSRILERCVPVKVNDSDPRRQAGEERYLEMKALLTDGSSPDVTDFPGIQH